MASLPVSPGEHPAPSRTRLLACVQSANCTVLSLVYMNNHYYATPAGTRHLPHSPGSAAGPGWPGRSEGGSRVTEPNSLVLLRPLASFIP